MNNIDSLIQQTNQRIDKVIQLANDPKAEPQDITDAMAQVTELVEKIQALGADELQGSRDAVFGLSANLENLANALCQSHNVVKESLGSLSKRTYAMKQYSKPTK